jgi:hypothetical protein
LARDFLQFTSLLKDLPCDWSGSHWGYSCLDGLVFTLFFV